MYGEHCGIIRSETTRQEEVAVGIGLTPAELGVLAARLAKYTRLVYRHGSSMQICEEALLAEVREAAKAHIVRRMRRLQELERAHSREIRNGLRRESDKTRRINRRVCRPA